jgi:hypothetical protein
MKRWTGIVAALLALALATAAQGFEAAFQAAREELAHGLDDHAGWCGKKKLYLERQTTYELLLTLEPDHEEARRILGYKRDRDGGWVAPGRSRPVKNYDEEALAEAPGRLRAVQMTYVGRMVALLEGGQLTDDQQSQVVAEALRIDPDNETVHSRLGEVRSDKGWVIPETLRASARRKELSGFVREALTDTPPLAEVERDEFERKIPLKMKAFTSGELRLVGTVDENEMALCAKAVHGMQRLLQLVFDTNQPLPRGARVFLLADPEQKKALLEHHPAIPASQLPLYEPLEGAGIQGTADFAFWTGDPQRRIDGIVRLVLGYQMSGLFRVTTRQGWAYEGFGLYMTRALVRSRLTWLAQPSAVLDAKSDYALRQKLIDPETNWMEETFLLFQDGKAPKLVDVLKKSANELTTEDVLVSYSLATYLLEVHPGEVGPLLKKLGTGYSSLGAFGEALGMTLGAFGPHLQRWLSERR